MHRNTYASTSAWFGTTCDIVVFKQYMPLKLVTHGIKLWSLACSITKYVLNLEVYVGAANEVIVALPSHACGSRVGVVARLTQGWKNRNHTVVMDNFFSSPMLFNDLLTRGFYAVGTIWQSKLGYPFGLNVPAKDVQRRTLQIHMHRDKKMCAIQWMDTKGVHFLSTSADPVKWYGMEV